MSVNEQLEEVHAELELAYQRIAEVSGATTAHRRPVIGNWRRRAARQAARLRRLEFPAHMHRF